MDEPPATHDAGPWFVGRALAAFTAFWTVYDAHHDAIGARMTEAALVLAPSLTQLSNRDGANRAAADNVALVWRAIRSGVWSELDATLEARAETFARHGVSLDEWSDLAMLAETASIPFVVAARGGDPDLPDILAAMHEFSCRSIRVARRRYRRAVAEVLAQHEARLAALAEATFEGLAMTRGNRIVDCNDQLAQMWRCSRAALIGATISDLIAPAWRERVAERIASGDEGPYHHICVRMDGTEFPVEVRARMVAHADGVIRISAIRDLTEHHRTLSELERVIKELRARTSEMEQFVYTVSHDLKSPLVTIKGFVGAVETDVAAGRHDDLHQDLKRIGKAADRMTSLLEDLLQLSRIGRVGTMSGPVKLADAVRAAVENVDGALVAANATVTLGELPAVRGDHDRLVQVFQNLIENAVKYRNDQAAPRIEISARFGAGATPHVVRVRDNGKGIAPEHHERIFGLFHKLDPGSPGTGVGLSLVRRIVAFHGGSVRVESPGLGHGSTFVIELPTT